MAIVGANFSSAHKPKTWVSTLPAPTSPLKKPVPEDLLAHKDIELTPHQRSAISKIAQEWHREKASLETAMAGYRPRQGRLDQVQDQLAAYSELSRQYEAKRILAWQHALAVLSQAQLRQVEP